MPPPPPASHSTSAVVHPQSTTSKRPTAPHSIPSAAAAPHAHDPAAAPDPASSSSSVVSNPPTSTRSRAAAHHGAPSSSPGSSSGSAVNPNPTDAPSKGVSPGVIAAVVIVAALVVIAILYRLWVVRKRRVQKTVVPLPAARSPFADPLAVAQSGETHEVAKDEKHAAAQSLATTLKSPASIWMTNNSNFGSVSSFSDGGKTDRSEPTKFASFPTSTRGVHQPEYPSLENGLQRSTPRSSNTSGGPDGAKAELGDSAELAAIVRYSMTAEPERTAKSSNMSPSSSSEGNRISSQYPTPNLHSDPDLSLDGSQSSPSPRPLRASSPDDTTARRTSLSGRQSFTLPPSHYATSTISRRSSRYSVSGLSNQPPLPGVRGAPHLPHIRGTVEIVLPKPLAAATLATGSFSDFGDAAINANTANSSPAFGSGRALSRRASRASLRADKTQTDPWTDAMLAARVQRDVADDASPFLDDAALADTSGLEEVAGGNANSAAQPSLRPSVVNAFASQGHRKRTNSNATVPEEGRGDAGLAAPKMPAAMSETPLSPSSSDPSVSKISSSAPSSWRGKQLTGS